MKNISIQDLDSVKTLIDNFKPRITAFEREILIPQLIGRLQYIVEIMRGFQELTEDATIARHIDAPLRNLVDPALYERGLPEPRVGQQYLAAIKRVCETEYIQPINDLLQTNPPEKILRGFEETAAFLNSAVTFFQSIVSTKDTLFLYSFKTFLNVREVQTGQVTLGPPTDLTLILMPFDVRLKEMVNVAETSIQSIQRWGEQAGEQKAKHVEIITQLCEIKASEDQARAARWSFYTQIAVVVVALVLIVGSYKANQYLEKKDLEDSLAETRSELREKVSALGDAAKKIAFLKDKANSPVETKNNRPELKTSK